MIKIIIITKPSCVACDIVKKVIFEAVSKINKDIALHILNTNEELVKKHNIKVYPTTIIQKTVNNHSKTFTQTSLEEIARLEGSFPIDYLNKVIDKVKLESYE